MTHKDCALCKKVFEGALLKVRTLYKDISNARGRGLKDIDYSNLTHTQEKLAIFIDDAMQAHHRLLLHKYEINTMPSEKGGAA